MKNDEKTEHLPRTRRRSFVLRRKRLRRCAARAKEDEQTVHACADRDGAPAAVDPDATIKTLRPQVADDCCSHAASRSADFAKRLRARHCSRRGQAPRTHRRCRRVGPLTGPDGTQVMSNRLVGSLEDAGEGHHGPLEPGSVIKKRFVLEKRAGQGRHGPGVRRHRPPQGRSARSESARRAQGAERGFPAPSASVHGSAARSAQGADARASERRHGVRLRPRRRCGLHDDGAAGRTLARLDDARSARQGHQARRRAADHSRHRRRSGVRASQGHRAFRPEARQRLHH